MSGGCFFIFSFLKEVFLSPSHYKSKKLIKKTKVYLKGDYNKRIAKTVFEGRNKGYYVCIEKSFMQIEVIDKNEENIIEIQNYLEFLFYKDYIGISLENNQGINLKLKDVKCFEC